MIHKSERLSDWLMSPIRRWRREIEWWIGEVKWGLREADRLYIVIGLAGILLITGIMLGGYYEDKLHESATTMQPSEPNNHTREMRIAKCKYIVQTLYPNSGFLPYCAVLIDEHMRLERECAADGYGEAWWWSLVYGAAEFGLQVGVIAPNNRTGPMGVYHRPPILEPAENIRYHCHRMLRYYKRGIRGIKLCEVMHDPLHPCDWNNGIFERTHKRFRRCITGATHDGILFTNEVNK